MIRSLLMTAAIAVQASFPAHAQTDLSSYSLTEHPASGLNDIGTVNGPMYERTDMVSWRIDANKTFRFQNYVPNHIEMLAYKDAIAGYAFRIAGYREQEAIKAFLLQTYPQLKVVDDLPYGRFYAYAGDDIYVDFRTMTEQSFREGRFGYLNVQRGDLHREIDAMEAKYQRRDGAVK